MLHWTQLRDDRIRARAQRRPGIACDLDRQRPLSTPGLSEGPCSACSSRRSSFPVSRPCTITSPAACSGSSGICRERSPNEDLARCCRAREFLADAIACTQPNGTHRGDIWALSLADDDIMSVAAVDEFHRNFAIARVVRSDVRPDEIGRPRVCHVGAFEQGTKALWQKMASWPRTGN